MLKQSGSLVTDEEGMDEKKASQVYEWDIAVVLAWGDYT